MDAEFKKRIEKWFSGMPNDFSISGDILIDEWGKNHDEMLEKVVWICRQVSLKHEINCISIPFFGEIISQQGLSPDPSKIQVLTDMPLLKMKK